MGNSADSVYQPTGFVKVFLATSSRLGELARCKFVLPDPFEKGRTLPQLAAVKRVRIQDSHRQADLLRDDPNRHGLQLARAVMQ
jgi:hypothetical protein